MLSRFFFSKKVDICFACTSPIDEVWIRSSAISSYLRGISVEVVICAPLQKCPIEVIDLYENIGINLVYGVSLAAAARRRCELVVTASSGLDRKIFPTRAKKFIHMPHSLASLHMIYPEGAFDGYDILFAAGPHHCTEFLALAANRKLDNRKTYPIGYGKLDVLNEGLSTIPDSKYQSKLILLAPSWGNDNLLDLCGVDLAVELANAGFQVVVRPHPLFFLDKASVIDDLRSLQSRNTNIRLESPFEGDNAIYHADLLVGDFSGIGFEFAALRRLKVVSVDVGLKIANLNWESLGIQPVEIAYRSCLGPVVAPDLDAILDAVFLCIDSEDKLSDKAISSFLYGKPGDCDKKAVVELEHLLNENSV